VTIRSSDGSSCTPWLISQWSDDEAVRRRSLVTSYPGPASSDGVRRRHRDTGERPAQPPGFPTGSRTSPGDVLDRVVLQRWDQFSTGLGQGQNRMIVEDRRLRVERSRFPPAMALVACRGSTGEADSPSREQPAGLLKDAHCSKAAVGAGCASTPALRRAPLTFPSAATAWAPSRLVRITRSERSPIPTGQCHTGVRGGRIAAVDQHRSRRKRDSEVGPRFARQ